MDRCSTFKLERGLEAPFDVKGWRAEVITRFFQLGGRWGHSGNKGRNFEKGADNGGYRMPLLRSALHKGNLQGAYEDV